MDPVFLHLAGRDLGEAKFAKEGAQVDADARLVPFGPAWAALAVQFLRAHAELAALD